MPDHTILHAFDFDSNFADFQYQFCFHSACAARQGETPSVRYVIGYFEDVLGNYTHSFAGARF